MLRNEIFFVAFWMLLGAGLLADSGARPEDARAAELKVAELKAAELKAMAGSWTPVATENNGYRASREDLAGDLWIRDADGTWTLWRGDRAVLGWAVRKIDPTQEPRSIDIEVTTGAHTGTVYLGIYELEGDRLRICFALPDKPERPTEFSAAAGTRRALSVFERQKK